MPAAIDEARDYEFIINLIYERCRIRLHDGKHQLIRARLGKRIRHHGFQTLREYCSYLRQQGDEEELTHMVDALTTNYTQFLREKQHFDFLVHTALPGLLRKQPHRFAIWSAACATGEEPYSLAFFLSEAYPRIVGWNWRIFATDVSTRALATAQRAVYPIERLESVPREWWKAYFQRGHGPSEGLCRVKPEISDLVSFQQINLLGEYSLTDQFEVIFCRNVMIYFDRPTQEQLVRRLAQFLVPHGYLIIGHSESLNGLNLGLRCLQPSIYQKA